MKAEELRIGNYLKSYNPIIKEECEWQIYKTDMVIICEAEDFSHYKPIPLTEEWLVNLGFEENTTSWTNWNKPNHTKEVRLTKAYGDVRFHNRVINHVHQLQNLYFALTNEELKLN